jgi:hypothetical protein
MFIVEFFKALVANIISKPLTTLTSLLTGITVILAQGEIVVPVDMKDTVTVIAAIIASIVLFFAKKVGVSIAEAKTSMAMRVTNDGNGGRG